MYQLMQPISQYYQEKGHLKAISPLIAECALKHKDTITQKACQKLQTTFLGEIKTSPFVPLEYS